DLSYHENRRREEKIATLFATLGVGMMPRGGSNQQQQQQRQQAGQNNNRQQQQIGAASQNQANSNVSNQRSALQIHQGQQDKHIRGTRNYNQQVANGNQPSILTEDPTVLLRESERLRGIPHRKNKTSFDFGRNIGQFYDYKTGLFHETTRGTIHSNDRGQAHIVPSRPSHMLN
ncbi:MAG: polymorphic toxin type 50 domain-containing protein, partial [Defluviitaleaceae bacterium]|nr:polymorphic toxin type 50 domain-containing protein [Defluviitaleaceae bacterium]